VFFDCGRNFGGLKNIREKIGDITHTVVCVFLFTVARLFIVILFDAKPIEQVSTDTSEPTATYLLIQPHSFLLLW
jgi:hypothetical protein